MRQITLVLSNTKRIKVLLYGNTSCRNYRSKILRNFLQDSDICYSQACPGFYRTNKQEHFFSIQKLFILLSWIELFTKAAFADVIYLLPMNARFIKSALWAANLFNKKLIVEMYISLYDTMVRDREMLDSGSKEARDCKKNDILALTKSDHVIHTAGHELTYWEKILDINIDRKKVLIAPICNVSTIINRRSFMQDGVLRICWWGTFIPLHGLDNILQAMKILKEREVQFTCNLFGVDTPLFSTYAEKIQLEQLAGHVFLRKDLRFYNDSLPKYLVDNCDLALGIFGNTDKAHNAVPNKLIEALSMGIPTLTMNSPALKEFFNPEDLWVCDTSPEAIAESILTIAGGAARPVDWEQTRQKVLSTFSIARYQEVVSKVLGRVTDDLLKGESLDVESGAFPTHQAALNRVER
jgi:glycosyltransferase involved in cell wall biosynthesis